MLFLWLESSGTVAVIVVVMVFASVTFLRVITILKLAMYTDACLGVLPMFGTRVDDLHVRFDGTHNLCCCFVL